MSKIILIGVNHAGTACANTILANGNNSLTAFDSNSNISFLGCGMALWIGGIVKDPNMLFYSNEKLLEEKGAKIHMETPVTNIDFNNKIVYAQDKNGKKYEEKYDKLILSTGSLPVLPDIPGKDLENVQQVKLYQDAKEVIEKLNDDSINKITVVGAGYIGVELAEAFKIKGKDVTLIDLLDTTLGGYYDKEFSTLMNDNLIQHNINLKLGECIKELKGENGKVTSVVTDKGVYDSDMVILCIGFKPNTELGKDNIELFKNGAYKVNKHQETSIKDVYAIGDCATIYDNSIDDYNYIALASNAVRSGIVGANNAMGINIESVGVQGSNGINIYGLGLFSTGITVEKAQKLGIDVLYTDFEDLQKPEFMDKNNEKVKIRIVYRKDNRQIIGAQLASKQDISLLVHTFSLAIQEKVTIDKLALTDLFFLPHFNKPYNYVTMAALNAK